MSVSVYYHSLIILYVIKIQQKAHGQPYLLSIRISADQYNRKQYNFQQAEDIGIVFKSVDHQQRKILTLSFIQIPQILMRSCILYSTIHVV